MEINDNISSSYLHSIRKKKQLKKLFNLLFMLMILDKTHLLVPLTQRAVCGEKENA